MYFIASDTYVKNVQNFIKTLFWPSALWLSELSNIHSCVHTCTSVDDYMYVHTCNYIII